MNQPADPQVRYLKAEGLATKNMASLPHITVVGAVGTATHGTGLTPGHEACLTAHCAGLEFVVADGSLVSYSREKDEDKFRNAVVHVGLLGVVARITMDVVESYTVVQHVYRGMMIPISTLADAYNEIASTCDSLTTGYNVGTGEVTLWRRFFLGRPHGHSPPSGDDPEAISPSSSSSSSSSAVSQMPLAAGAIAPAEVGGGVVGTGTPPSSLLGLPLLSGRVPFFELGPSAPGVQTTRVGPWHDVPTFFMDDGEPRAMPAPALQSEFFCPLDKAKEVLETVAAVASKWPGWYMACAGTEFESNPVVYHCEIRAIPSDTLGGLSPYADRRSIAIHFTWGDSTRVEHIAPLIEDIQSALRPFGCRPHYGKLNTVGAAELKEVLPAGHLDAFLSLVKLHDPEGKFVNEYMRERVLG
jgi:xylitol oxidase